MEQHSSILVSAIDIDLDDCAKTIVQRIRI